MKLKQCQTSWGVNKNHTICYGSCEKHSVVCGICGLLFRDIVLFFSPSDSGQGYMLEGGTVEPDGSQPKRTMLPRTPWSNEFTAPTWINIQILYIIEIIHCTHTHQTCISTPLQIPNQPLLLIMKKPPGGMEITRLLVFIK